MAESKVMLFEADEKIGMRCRFISEWCKIVSYMYATGEGLLLEVKKHNPDVVFINLNLYARIDGIKTSQIIRCQYSIPVMYIW
jgi:DNA-binding response OmpR family regulator